MPAGRSQDSRSPANAAPRGAATSGAKPAGSAPRKKSNSQKVENLPPLIEISNERKLDILGIVMAFAGILIGLALLQSAQSSGPITGSIRGGLDFVFGAGIYVLPVALFLFGGWLSLRKIEKIPQLSAERVIGFFLLFLLIQTTLQTAGGFGGWLGSVIYNLFTSALGFGGLLVLLIAWGLIVLIMLFDLSIPLLLEKLKPRFELLIKQLGFLIYRLLNAGAGSQPSPADLDMLPAQDGFIPLNLPDSENLDGSVAARDASPQIPGSSPSQIEPQIGIPVSAPLKQIKWVLPSIKDILESGKAPQANDEFIAQRIKIIEETLISFGAPAKVVQTSQGPTITQFGVEPGFVESRKGRIRVRVSKIVGLSDDLALALAAPAIRIQAPVPGRSYVGIEVPNSDKTVVNLRDILEGDAYNKNKKTLSFALGRDVSGGPVGADLAGMPHLLIAGTTGSGKSVCVNAILTSLLLSNSPDQVRLVLVDPKRVELTGYNGIPHLLAPVVVEMDKVLGALQWMTREMDRRYHTFAQVGARNITDYNTRMKARSQRLLPFLVIVIDELADLMMIAPDETEKTITRLAQLARATGIHMVLATQRPSVDVLTGLIKANFPARIAFAVSSNTDSRVILDQPGAERLLGRGDMLYQAPEAPAPVRLQGVFVSDYEIHSLVEFWQQQADGTAPAQNKEAVDGVPANVPLKQTSFLQEDITARVDEADVLLTEAIDLVRREGRASVSMLQRKLRIGYSRATRMIDAMEDKKIVGAPQDATGVRPVLDYGPAAPPKDD